MHRRSFLKLVAALSVGAAMPLGFDWTAVAAAAGTVSAGGRLYRSNGSGRVYVSKNKGKTWSVHSDLGPNCPVQRLTVDRRGRLHAKVGFRRWSFGLVLAPDRRSWLTT